MKLSELIVLLTADLDANGDTDHVALGTIVKSNDTAYRLDAHGPVDIVRDPNYDQGMAVLVADGIDGAALERLTAISPARRFMQELLDSVETLTGIAEEYGSRTLADLFYLHSAILNGGFIDHYPGESKVLDIASSLPSGQQWAQFIKVEHMASPFTPQEALPDATSRQYRVGVDRTGYRSCTIFVLATSPEEAKSKALKQAGDHDFASEHDFDYGVSFAEPDDTRVGAVT